MTRISIELPEPLAESARAAGLLEPTELERVLEEELRRRALARLAEIGRQLTDEAPMSMEEIQEEVRAVRAERRGRREAGA